nr:MAG TPA: tail tape measure [Caudoviricetes sp.]
MSDKLAVIQAEETVKELDKLEAGVTKLINSFSNLNTAVDQTNTKLNRGTPKETIEGIKDLDGYSKEYMRTLKDMATIEQKTQQIRLTNARITTEQVRAAKELANQQNAEARAKKQALSLQEKQNKILSESQSYYKRFASEVLDAKNKAKELAAQMQLLEHDFKNGKIGVSVYEKQLSKLSKEFTEAKLKAVGLDSALKKIDKSVGDNQRNVGNYQSALNGMGSGFGGMMSRAGSIAGGIIMADGARMLGDIATQSYETVQKLNAVNYAMKEVFQTEEEVGYQKEFLSSAAEKYGLELISLTDSYTKFSAAAKNTSLEGEKAKEVFEAFAGAGAKLGLPAEQIEGVYTALEQMVSKGNIQAEELRGQLGERLPGAMKIFADAMGVSTSELDDMLKKGQVVAGDVLPKVAEELKKVYGLDTVDRIDTLAGAQNRLKNQWTEFLDTLATNKDFINAISDVLEIAKGLLEEFLDLAITGGADGVSIMGELKDVFEAVGDVLNALTGNLFDNGKGWDLVNLVVNQVKTNLVAISTVIKLVIKGIEYFVKSIKDAIFGTEDAIKMLGDFGSIIDSTKEKLSSLHKENTAILSGDEKTLQNLKNQKELENKLIEARKKGQRYFVHNNIWRDTNALGMSTNKRANEYAYINGELVPRSSIKVVAPPKAGNDKAKKKKKTPKGRVKKEKTQEQLDKEAFDKARKDLDFEHNKLLEKFRRQRVEAQNELTGYDLLVKEIEIDSLVIKEKDTYYTKLLDLAKKYKQEQREIESQKSKDLFDENESQQDKMRQLNQALLEKNQKEIEYIKLLGQETAEYKKQMIMNDKSISYKDKQYFLELLEYDTTIAVNKREKEKLQLLKEQLEAKRALLQEQGKDLNEDEKVQLAQTDLQITQLDTSIMENEKNKANKMFLRIVEGLEPLKNLVEQNLADLGLDAVSKQFSDLYSKILQQGKDFSMSFADYMNMATALISDFAGKAISSGKERTIAELDEELERSKMITETELGFIDKRLDALNGLSELTEEQIAERNALEDEAMVIKEQQAQKEKMIQAQKARAEQKAQAQQALMNGALGATQSIAQLGVPAGLVPAGIALAFGALQAGLIMSKNPVPQYFVGTKNAPQGWAWTDERGAEIHTDKHGNIKDLGSDKGARLKYLEQGDRIYTASETRKILENIKTPALDEVLLSNGIVKNIQVPMNINTPAIDYDKLATKIGEQQDRVMRKYDKTSVFELNGYIYTQKGGQIPVAVSRVKKTKNTIKIKGNERD